MRKKGKNDGGNSQEWWTCLGEGGHGGWIEASAVAAGNIQPGSSGRTGGSTDAQCVHTRSQEI